MRKTAYRVLTILLAMTLFCGTAFAAGEIYVNNGFYPQCYAAAWNDGKQIMIGMDLE